MNRLLEFLHSGAQGASNAAASTISAPVDLISWLLRKGGIPVPENAIGGSPWMAQKGLLQEPQNRLAGLLGEGLGMAIPSVAAAKAPQIAQGLLRGAENLAAPAALNRQAGVMWVAPNRVDKSRMPEIEEQMQKLGPPKIKAYWDGEKYLALEGSHRLQAAKNLGIEPIPDEVRLRSWLKGHDFEDLPEKTSVLRALNYLEQSGPHIRFD